MIANTVAKDSDARHRKLCPRSRSGGGCQSEVWWTESCRPSIRQFATAFSTTRARPWQSEHPGMPQFAAGSRAMDGVRAAPALGAEGLRARIVSQMRRRMAEESGMSDVRMKIIGGSEMAIRIAYMVGPFLSQWAWQVMICRPLIARWTVPAAQVMSAGGWAARGVPERRHESLRDPRLLLSL
jgi:hypothetical protein